MSSVPSPLKSPLAITVQSVATCSLYVDEFEVKLPFAVPSQSVSWPVLWRHKMSLCPSPLKSPTAATVQSEETPTVAAPFGLNPPFAFPSQSVSNPLSLRQRMSSRPSPLKSPVPATCQSVVTFAKAFAPLG